jgi:hypothetical protein
MMDPFDPLNGFNSLPMREFERLEPLRRAVKPFAAVAQQMNYAERIMREIQPFRRIQEQIGAATARSFEQFELQDRLARSVQPIALAAATAANSAYLESLIKSQQALSQVAAQEVVNASRIALEAATTVSVFANAMGGFTERILTEAVFRETLASNLAATYASMASAAAIKTNYDGVIDLVLQGLTEAGAADTGLSGETFLWKIHAWLELLPPNVKNIVIQFIAGLMLLILTEAVDWCKTSAYEHVAALPKSGPAAQSAPQDWPDNDMCH